MPQPSRERLRHERRLRRLPHAVVTLGLGLLLATRLGSPGAQPLAGAASTGSVSPAAEAPRPAQPLARPAPPAASAAFAPLPPRTPTLNDQILPVTELLEQAGGPRALLGAAWPLGMLLPSPQWLPAADAGGPMRLAGFANTHCVRGAVRAEGPPCELGDVLLMPALGQRWGAASDDFSAPAEAAHERARPGYYSTLLPTHGVRVELTAQPRVALQRYTFHEGGSRAQLMVDLQHSAAGPARSRETQVEAQVDAALGEISGTLRRPGPQAVQLSFVIKLDRPIDRVTAAPGPSAGDGSHNGRFVLDLSLGATRMVVVRVALSTVDVDGARRNLAAAGRPLFHEARQAAERQWLDIFGRVDFEADERTRRQLYSALYRVFLQVNELADVDGRVRGPRGLVLSARSGSYLQLPALAAARRYTVPLLALLAPERLAALARTLLEHQRQQGYLPLSTWWGRETWAARGNPALPVLAESLAAGLQRQAGFSAAEVLEAMFTSSTAERPDAPLPAQVGWAWLDRLGYLPVEAAPEDAVAATLDVALGDDAVARVARAAGREDLARAFAARSRGWESLFQGETLQWRGRDAQGQWAGPYAAPELGLVAAQLDPVHWRTRLGGPLPLRYWLNGLVTQARGLGAEPPWSLELPWLYGFTDLPERGAALARHMALRWVARGPVPMAAGDEGGQRSAWFVFQALGFQPGEVASGSIALAQPLVRAASLRWSSGRRLRIVADGTASNEDSTLAWLNGEAMAGPWLTRAQLMAGGELRIRSTPRSATP